MTTIITQGHLATLTKCGFAVKVCEGQFFRCSFRGQVYRFTAEEIVSMANTWKV